MQVNDEHSAEGGEDPAAEEEVVRIASDPGQPSHRQVEEHRTRGHIRNVCGANGAILAEAEVAEVSRTEHGQNPPSPFLALHYFLLTEAGAKFRSELELSEEALQEARSKGEIVKCLAVRCLEFNPVFAHVVPCKGSTKMA